MQKIIRYIDSHKSLFRIILAALIIWGMYKYFPYLLMDKPYIHTIEPDKMIERTFIDGHNLLKISGTNLKNIIGVYINGVYESDCTVTSSSGEELTLSLPPQYYQEAQNLSIQIEVRINSDLTCISNKCTVSILPEETLPVPLIDKTMPPLLCYDDTLLQPVSVYGENFTTDSVVSVNGTPYLTVYDESAESLSIQIPYERWCSEEDLALQVIQYYNGDPTQVKSRKFFLETDRAERKTNSRQRQWIRYPFLAQSFGEMEGLADTNSKEAFLYNYERGQRLFGVRMTFSSDCVLYGDYMSNPEQETILPKSFVQAQRDSEVTLLRFEDICELMHDYEDIYIYTSLQDVQDLRSFHATCQYMLAYVAQTDPEILERLIIPVQDKASYHLLLELEPLANIVYAPGNPTPSEDEIVDFLRSADVNAMILPWEIITPSLNEALRELPCPIYASDLEDDDDIIYALANGASGIASEELPVEHWQVLEAGFQTSDAKIPSVSPIQSENSAFLIDYLHALNSERYLILFSAKDEASSQLTPAIQMAMKSLGLASIPTNAFQYSYIAVIENGTVSYEECSNSFLQYAGNHEGVELYVESGGFNVGNVSSIQVNGTEYSLNQRGLNIVVYDTLLGRVMDSVCFDLYDGVTPSFSEN